MSELQTESSDIQENAEVIANPDNGAELATASESEHIENTETVDEVESEASKQQKYINTQYGQIKQGERDLAKANDQLAKLQSEERERMAAQVGNIPPMPDAFDDDFDAKVKVRDEAIIAQANYNTSNQNYLQNQQNIQLQQQQEAQVKAINLQNDFATNAKGAGATDEEFNSVINILNVGGMTPQGADAIMSLGVDGYFIAKHLAANNMEANEFNSLSPVMQGMRLVELKQKSSALRPKTSNTPSPATNLQGNGAGEQKHPALNGVIYS